MTAAQVIDLAGFVFPLAVPWLLGWRSGLIRHVRFLVELGVWTAIWVATPALLQPGQVRLLRVPLVIAVLLALFWPERFG